MSILFVTATNYPQGVVLNAVKNLMRSFAYARMTKSIINLFVQK
jgi:hypothetical protein